MITAKKLAACLLALLMGLALAACVAVPGGTVGGDAQADAQALAAQNTERVLSGEYIYVSEYLPLESNEQEHISPRAYTEDGFYTVDFVKVGDDIPEDVEERYEGEFAVYETRLYFTGYDGRVRELEKFEAMGAPENTDDLADFSSGVDLGGFVVADDGSIFTVENTYCSWYDGPAGLGVDNPSYWDHQQYANELYLRHLDADGVELSRAKLQTEGDYIYSHSIRCDGEGRLLLLSDSGVCVYSPKGEALGRITCENYPDSLLCLGDGRNAVSYWAGEGFTVAVLDIQQMSLEPLYVLPDSAYALTDGAGEYALFYIYGGDFYGVKSSDGSHEKLFNWINCDVSMNSISTIKAMDDGSFITVSNTYRAMGAEDYVYEAGVITLKKLPVEDVPERTVLSFSTAYLDQEASDAIVEFNRENKNYRIEVIDYFDYNTAEDISIGSLRLIGDLKSGRGADIIDLDSLPYELLAARGLLEDLYPYIDRDEVLSREDFFSSVLSALEVDGKLCSTAAGMSVNTLLASDTVLTDTDGWTYEQLIDALTSMPEGCRVFDAYTTSGDVMRNFLPFEIKGCIDWKSGECRFDNESFLALMDFAALFPREFDWANYRWEEVDSSEYRLSHGLQLLALGTLHSFDDMNYSTAYFGSDVNYVGYPGYDGQFRSSLILSHRYAINSASENKAGAWEFIRSFMGSEYQSRNVWNFPVRVDVYEQGLEKAVETSFLTDEQGELILDENEQPIILPIGKMGGIEGRVIDVYPLSELKAEKLMNLLSSSDTLSDISALESIGRIVIEEADRFFSGELSAEDAAGNMNVKVSEYLKNTY